jgi:acetoin utilization protein AcuB
MFHIHSISGIEFNIPLESLGNDEQVERLEKSYRARKMLSRDHNRNENTGSDEKLSVAVKAYKNAVRFDNEREPILHAYTIMKSPVFTLDPEISISDAWNLMRQHSINHMPALSPEKKLVGIVSDRDILKHLYNINAINEDTISKTVSDIMTKKVITADRLTDIRRIAKAMFEKHIGTMPIVDEAGLLIGIITRSDILYALINYPPLSLWA